MDSSSMWGSVQSQFGYLQVYSRSAAFGGVSNPENLAARLIELAQDWPGPVAAALTDTYSLAAYPQWRKLLAGSKVLPLAGVEVGLNWTERGLPYALLLLAYNQTGFANLCALVSQSLQRAGRTPLLAMTGLDALQHYQEGLIAIAPGSGGPVMAALATGKHVEAKQRAQTLRDIFGPENFFLGVPPPNTPSPGQPPRPQEPAEEAARRIRQNASLVKLGRDLKIGLIATAETRYALQNESRDYAAQRSRLQRALSAQYPPHLLQSSEQDWLFSLQPARLAPDTPLRPRPELLEYYNDSDWPGALGNNRAVAARCTEWQPASDRPQAELQEWCQTRLAALYDGRPAQEQALARQRLEEELASIAELDLAEALLGAALVVQQAQPGHLVIVRRLGGSLVAYLLGLTAQPPDLNEEYDYPFEAYTGGRAIRLEVSQGQGGRERLLAGINKLTISDAIDPARWQSAPLALSSPDTGALPALHPRQMLTSLNGPLALTVPLVPAETQDELKIGAQTGPVMPEGTTRLEISESAGLSSLQLALDILNRQRAKTDLDPLGSRELPRQPDKALTGVATFERNLLLTQLEWCHRQYPAAYYAALLTLSAGDPARLAALSEQVRREGLALLPPDIRHSEIPFSVEPSDSGSPLAIRAGLGVFGAGLGERILKAREAGKWPSLDDLVAGLYLTAAEVEQLAWAGALDAFGPREALAAAAGQIETASGEWREWREYEQQAAASPGAASPASRSTPGQLSLFDLFEITAQSETAPAPVRSQPSPVVLPEVPTLNRLERLRHAYRVLGFLNSEHPLWGQLGPGASDTERDSLVPLAQAQQTTAEARPLLVAGLVVGLRRVPVALAAEQTEGEELTVVLLEDFSGRAEILVPRATPLDEVELAEGAALTIRARSFSKTRRLVLIALALAHYPSVPGLPVPPGQEEGLDPQLDAALAAEPEQPAEVAADEGWASSLFASMGIVDPARPAPAQGAGRSRGGKAPPPPRITRRVHIWIPQTASDEAERKLMQRLKELLRQHPGDDPLTLYIPQPDGSLVKLEPQSLSVNYSEAFAAAVIGLAGPGSIKLDERVI